MHVVMVEPEIPGNTGNVSRLCAANHITHRILQFTLFSLEDKYLKRAGLDYWDLLDLHVHENFEEVQQQYPNSRYFYLTDIVFREDDMLVFGKETKGLPEDLLKRNADYCFRIPMIDKARSLNLSNAVAIVSYEALRQLGFPGMTGGKGIENL